MSMRATDTQSNEDTQVFQHGEFGLINVHLLTYFVQFRLEKSGMFFLSGEW